MKYIYKIAIVLALLIPGIAFAVAFQPAVGGTGSTTLSGILIGNGTSPVNTLIVGSGLSLTGTTLTATGGSGVAYSFTPGTYGTLNVSATTTAALEAYLGLISATSTIGTVNATSSLTIAALSGLVGAHNGLTYAVSTSSLNASITGNAGTATALAANGTNCSSGSYALGVDASGNAEGCTVANLGTVTGVTATYPILSTGGTTPVISTAFGTTSTLGIGNNLFLYTNASGVMVGVASSSLDLPNTALQNSSVTVNTTAPLGGGGAVSLGGAALTLTCTSCSTFAYPFTPSTFGIAVSATSTPILDYPGLIAATSTFGTILASSSITDQPLATPAGTFIAADPSGKLIATTTPTGSGSSYASPPANYATVAGLPSYTYAAGVITAVANGALSVDGNNPSVGQRVLVKNESGACTSSAGTCNNGLYDVTTAGSAIAAFVLTRDSAYNSSSNVIPGVITYVISGATLDDDFYALTTAAPITVGSSGLTYVEVSGGGASVTSVANSDSTLTISPTTGNVVASLNLAHTNTWSVLQNFAALTATNATTTSLSTGSTTLATLSGAGLSSCSGASNAVSYTLATGLFGCNSITGSGSAFPFTVNTPYNSTSTVIGFTAGLFSNASTSLATTTAWAFDGIVNAAEMPGADIGAQINQAYANLPSTGGQIYVPAGSYSYSTAIVFGTNNKPVQLTCAPGGATTLTYTGTATSTTFNTGFNTIFAGNGVDGCTFSGTSDLGVGIGVGGTQGDPGIVLNDINVINYATGIVWGSNTWNTSLTNSRVQNDNQLMKFYVSNNSGERMSFYGDVFADALTNTTDGILFQTNAISSASFTGVSFDDTGWDVGSGNTSITCAGCHFENPNWNGLAVYNYIEASSSQGTSISLNGGFLLNDATTALKTPTQFILNGANVSLSGVSVESNANATTDELPSVVNNFGTNAGLSALGMLNGGADSYKNIATSSVNLSSDQWGGAFQTGLNMASLPFQQLFTLNSGDPVTFEGTAPTISTTQSYALYAHNLNSINASSTGIGFAVSSGDPLQSTGVVGADIVLQRIGSGSFGNLLFDTANSATNLKLGAEIDNKQHVAFGGPISGVTVATCGTSPTITGNDDSGTITMGTGATVACTITFGTTYTNVPHVFVSLESTIATTSVLDVAPSAGSFIVRSSTGMGGAKVDYFVVGSTTLPVTAGTAEPTL